jgi:hypothetical protein
MLIALPFLLTACAGWRADDPRPVPPPPSLTALPPGPTTLPLRALTQAEVEVFWGRDRSALRMCVGQVEGLAAWAGGHSDDQLSH